MPSINIDTRCKVSAKEVQLVSLEGQMQSSAGSINEFQSIQVIKQESFLTEPRLLGFACVTYLSHSSGFLWDFWSPPLSHLKDIICCGNSDIKFRWQELVILIYAKQSVFIPGACDLVSSNCSEFNLLLEFGEDVGKGRGWEARHLWELP